MAFQRQTLVAQRNDAGGPLTADAELTPLQTDADGNLRVASATTIVEDVLVRRELEVARLTLDEIRAVLWDGFERLLARPARPDAIVPEFPLTATLTLGTSAEVIPAPTSGLRLYVRRVTVSNTSGTLTRLDLTEGSDGTVRYSMGLAANGGGVRERFEPYWRLPPETGLFGILSVAVTDVRINVDYYVAREAKGFRIS